VQGDEAVRRGGVHDVLPQDAGADAGDPRPGVDGHAAHPGGLHEDRAAEVAQRTRVVTRRLGRDPQPRGARGAHDLGHLTRVRRVGDGRGALVEGEVEGLAGGVVPIIPGEGDGTAAEITQGSRAGIDHRHGRTVPHRRCPSLAPTLPRPKAT
jgi:hypothetical protein